MYVYAPHACLVPRRSDKDAGSIVFHVLGDGCELTCGCKELNLGLLEEKSELLMAEAYLQPHG